MIKCSQCGIEFSKELRKNLELRCPNCRKIRDATYHQKTKVHHNQIVADGKRLLKLEVMSYYSNGEPQCKVCGNTGIKHLSIDHINGGGSKHTKEIGGGGNQLYRWLKQNDYPDGFQVLCMNCNFDKKIDNKEQNKHR